MKIYLQVSILFVCLLTTSCQRTIIRLAGFKPPQIETKESVTRFLKNAKLENTVVLAIDSAVLMDLQSKPFKPGWKPSFRPIQFRTYDSRFNPVMHWASCEGYLTELKTFDTVPPRNKINLDSTFNLEQDLERYFTLDGNPARLKPDPGYDYYMVIYFALYTHRYSKKILHRVDRYIKENPEYKFKVYLVNTDVMDWWNSELVSKISIH